MAETVKDFEFYVGGIEDAILQLLKNEMRGDGVKTFATYSGELSEPDQLKKALGELIITFPLVMVSYADGEDKQNPVTSPVGGEPIHFKHNCTFVVICASSDARGELAQRRGKLSGTKKIGCYKMLSKVRDILSGLQIETIAENADGEDEEVLLTYAPLVPEGNEFIARLPNITAYAVPFNTYFKWSSKDRSANDGSAVEQVVLDVTSLNTSGLRDENKPGVRITT